MNTNRLTFAAIAAAILAAAVAFANVPLKVNVSSLTGYILAAGLIALVVLEYVARPRALRR